MLEEAPRTRASARRILTEMRITGVIIFAFGRWPGVLAKHSGYVPKLFIFLIFCSAMWLCESTDRGEGRSEQELERWKGPPALRGYLELNNTLPAVWLNEPFWQLLLISLKLELYMGQKLLDTNWRGGIYCETRNSRSQPGSYRVWGHRCG
jgi:hypothetical protein